MNWMNEYAPPPAWRVAELEAENDQLRERIKLLEDVGHATQDCAFERRQKLEAAQAEIEKLRGRGDCESVPCAGCGDTTPYALRLTVDAGVTWFCHACAKTQDGDEWAGLLTRVTKAIGAST